MCWYVHFGTPYTAWFPIQRVTLLHVTGRTHDRQMRRLHRPKWRKMMETQQQERGVTTRHGGVLGSCPRFDQATRGASCQAQNESSPSSMRRPCDGTCNKDEGTSRSPLRHQVSVWLLAQDAVCLREKRAKMSAFMLQEMWGVTVSSVKIHSWQLMWSAVIVCVIWGSHGGEYRILLFWDGAVYGLVERCQQCRGICSLYLHWRS